jgi:hypothetical protein
MGSSFVSRVCILSCSQAAVSPLRENFRAETHGSVAASMTRNVLQSTCLSASQLVPLAFCRGILSPISSRRDFICQWRAEDILTFTEAAMPNQNISFLLFATPHHGVRQRFISRLSIRFSKKICCSSGTVGHAPKR